MRTDAQARREFEEGLYLSFCRTNRLDPEDTQSMVAYEEEVSEWYEGRDETRDR